LALVSDDSEHTALEGAHGNRHCLQGSALGINEAAWNAWEKYVSYITDLPLGDGTWRETVRTVDRLRYTLPEKPHYLIKKIYDKQNAQRILQKDNWSKRCCRSSVITAKRPSAKQQCSDRHRYYRDQMITNTTHYAVDTML